ncbi:hypothetical protein BHE74_00033958 [Ensete ventricosum]|nr:hypothetical protein BHE74_00033958 [Ensete ventricosum]
MHCVYHPVSVLYRYQQNVGTLVQIGKSILRKYSKVCCYGYQTCLRDLWDRYVLVYTGIVTHDTLVGPGVLERKKKREKRKGQWRKEEERGKKWKWWTGIASSGLREKRRHRFGEKMEARSRGINHNCVRSGGSTEV